MPDETDLENHAQAGQEYSAKIVFTILPDEQQIEIEFVAQGRDPERGVVCRDYRGRDGGRVILLLIAISEKKWPEAAKLIQKLRKRRV